MLQHKIIFALAVAFPLASSSQSSVNQANAEKTQVIESNEGQWEPIVKYRAKSKFGTARFLQDGVSYVTQSYEHDEEGNEVKTALVWNTYFNNSSEESNLISASKKESQFNYINERSGANAITSKLTDKIVYQEIYEGMDALFYQTSNGLKYDINVKPNADINDLQLRYEGIDHLEISRAGELEIYTELGAIVDATPFSYQLIDGKQIEVDVRYDIINENTIGFKVFGDYDNSKLLVIDPIVLHYSTFIPPVSLDGDGYLRNLEADPNYNMIATGYEAREFPTTPGVFRYANGLSNKTDAVVSKLSEDGSTLMWATYIGGNGTDLGYGLLLEDDGNILVSGSTGSTNFPTSGNAYRRNLNDTETDPNKTDEDFFIFRLSGDGKRMINSTYLGGTKQESPYGGFQSRETTPGSNECIVKNSLGQIIISGNSFSTDYPRVGAYQNTHGGGVLDVVVSGLSNDLSSLLFSTYVGGDARDVAMGGIGLDQNDNIFVSGSSESAQPFGWPKKNSWPTVAGSYDRFYNTAETTGWVIKMNPTANQLLRSSFVSGPSSGTDSEISAMHISDAGEVMLAGYIDDDNFNATSGAYDQIGNTTWQVENTVRPGEFWDRWNNKGVVLKMNNDLSQITYATYLGAMMAHMGTDPGSDSAGANMHINDIHMGKDGRMYIAGYTEGDDYPVTSCAIQTSNKSVGNNIGDLDIVFSILDPTGSTLEYSTYWGSGMNTYHPYLEIKESDCGLDQIWIAATVHALYNYVTTPNAYSRINNIVQGDKGKAVERGEDTWGIFSIKPNVTPDFEFTTSSGCGSPIQFNDLSVGNNHCLNWNGTPPGSWAPTGWLWEFGDGNVSTEQNPSYSYGAPGTYDVTLHVNCPNMSITKTVTVSEGSLGLELGPDITECQVGSHTLTVGNQPVGTSYQWSTGATTQTISVNQAGTYSVTIRNGGCTATDEIVITQSPPMNPTVNQVTHVDCQNVSGSARANPNDGGGNNGPYTYSWSHGANTRNVSGLAPGQYTVTVTNADGCSGTASVTIQNNGGTLGATIQGVVQPTCSGALGTATAVPGDGGATAPYTYLWSNGQTTATATGLTSGDHTVTITNSTGCTGTETVTIQGAGGMDVDASIVYDDGCDRNGGSLGNATATPTGGEGPYTYQWDDLNNQTSQTAVGLSIGTYTVVVTDKNGCTATQVVEIEQKIQIVFFVNKHPCSSCNDGQVTGVVNGFGAPPFTYRWNDANEQTTLSATGLPPGEYILLVTDANGCYNSDTITIGGPQSIEDPLVEDPFSIYPNPNNGEFRVEIPQQGNTIIRLFDARGRLVNTRQLAGGVIHEMDLDLPSGVYYVELSTETAKSVKKVLITEP